MDTSIEKLANAIGVFMYRKRRTTDSCKQKHSLYYYSGFRTTRFTSFNRLSRLERFRASPKPKHRLQVRGSNIDGLTICIPGPIAPAFRKLFKKQKRKDRQEMEEYFPGYVSFIRTRSRTIRVWTSLRPDIDHYCRYIILNPSRFRNIKEMLRFLERLVSRGAVLEATICKIDAAIDFASPISKLVQYIDFGRKSRTEYYTNERDRSRLETLYAGRTRSGRRYRYKLYDKCAKDPHYPSPTTRLESTVNCNQLPLLKYERILQMRHFDNVSFQKVSIRHNAVKSVLRERLVASFKQEAKIAGCWFARKKIAVREAVNRKEIERILSKKEIPFPFEETFQKGITPFINGGSDEN